MSCLMSPSSSNCRCSSVSPSVMYISAQLQSTHPSCSNWSKSAQLSVICVFLAITGWIPVLTATSLSYGKAKKSTATESKRNPWSDWDKIWHSWLCRRVDPSGKIFANPFKGASRQMGEIYAIFYLYMLFSSTHLQVRPLKIFLRLICQTTRLRTRKCLLGVRKLKFNI